MSDCVFTKKRKRFFRGELVFYAALMVWPLLHFAVFYIGVNFNSFRLAFTDMDGGLTGSWFANLFDGDKQYFDMLLATGLRSLEYWAVSVLIGTPLALLFAHYVFKKMRGGKFFRLVLFLPSILSAMVMVLLFNRFVNDALVAVIKTVNPAFEKMDIFTSENYTAAMLFFGIWIGFGTSVLIYSNSMSEISPEVLESARLDGAGAGREMWHIVLPSIFPNITVFLVTGLATVFVNQWNMYSFFQDGVIDGGTLGYYIYLNVSRVARDIVDPAKAAVYHQFSALGLLLTAITIPVVFTVRWLFKKFGPSAD